MARRANELGPTIVVVNPDEDCSAAAGAEIVAGTTQGRALARLLPLDAEL